MVKLYKEAEIKGFGRVYRTDVPFDEALEVLKEKGISKLITTRDLAYSRMSKQRDHSLNNNGSYVMEGVIYIPDKTLFIRNSPILNQKLAQEATQAHGSLSEFYIDDNLTKKYQEQLEKDENKNLTEKRVLSLDKRGVFKLPTNRFGDEELTLWLFKDLAEDYGNFLKDNKIKKIKVYLTNNNQRYFANQLWLYSLDYDSDVNGCSRGLDYADGVRGVLESCEAGAKNLPSPKILYNRQIDTHISRLNQIAQGKIKPSDLEKEVTKVSDFLEKLKN